MVIVGGGVSTAGEKFWRPLRQTVERLVFPVYRRNYRLVPPKLGQGVVVAGAALLAAHRFPRGLHAVTVPLGGGDRMPANPP